MKKLMRKDFIFRRFLVFFSQRGRIKFYSTFLYRLVSPVTQNHQINSFNRLCLDTMSLPAQHDQRHPPVSVAVFRRLDWQQLQWYHANEQIMPFMNFFFSFSIFSTSIRITTTKSGHADVVFNPDWRIRLYLNKKEKIL